MVGRRKAEAVEEPRESAAKLHGGGRRQAHGVVVHARKGVVHDDAWAALILWDNTQGGETEAGKVPNQSKRQDGPVALLNKVEHFGAEEGGVGVGRLVAAAKKGGRKARRGPRGGVEAN
jgi:hypothetical protein